MTSTDKETAGIQAAEATAVASTTKEEALDMTESDDLLDEWVSRYTRISPRSPEIPTLRYVAAWLRAEATPDHWHRTPHDLNWDYGDHPFRWIARQPQCERATALSIFYLARPGQLLEYGNDRTRVPKTQALTFDLVTEIRDRFMAGFYAVATVAFDSGEAFRTESYTPEDATEAQIAPVIPLAMRESITGRQISNQWDRPPSHWL